jgi:beta-lactamase regulating signal transducer with metallopeptidase domain
MLFIANSSFLKALGWALIHSLWQFALLVLLYAAITRVFPNIKAAIKHSLSLYLLITGSVWFLFNLAYQYYFFFQYNSYISYGIIIDELLVINNWISFRGWINNWSPYLSIAYLLMTGILLLRLVTWFFNTRYQPPESIHKTPVEWKLFTQRMSDQLGITKKITLAISSFTDTPQVIGFLKPVILLPVSCITNLSLLQIEAILLHELAHIKRNDYFINVFTAFTSVFFFFNPFARYFINELRNERENACDDWVLQFCYPAQEYAAALLQLEKSRASFAYLQVAASGNKKKQLLHRIQRILKASRPPQTSSFIWINLAVIIAFLLLLSTNPSNINLPGGAVQNFTPFFDTYLIATDGQPENNNAIYQLNMHENNRPIPSIIITKESIRDQQAIAENKPPTLLFENELQLVAEIDKLEQVVYQPLLTELPATNFSYSYAEPTNNSAMLESIEQQPFFPTNSYNYYYVPDSALVQADIKEYAESILQYQLKSKEISIKQRNKEKVTKQLAQQLEAIQQLIEDKTQLAEGIKLQREVIEKIIIEKQNQLQKKPGKKRIVYI